MQWISNFFPDSWYQSIRVERGGGGLDRWGEPLPNEYFDVDYCLLQPRPVNDDDELGAWSETYGAITHESFAFQQNDIIVVPDGERNAGRWEVQAPSSEWVPGTETRIKRVNQRG